MYKNLVGLKFNKLTVVSRTNIRDTTRSILWECLCDCGNTHYVQTNRLKKGKVKSCGCAHRNANLQDLSGKYVNGVLIVRMSDKRTGRSTYCFAICPVCKKEWETQVKHLKSKCATQCRNCSQMKLNSMEGSKTCTQLLDKIEERFHVKVMREYKIKDRLYDGYIDRKRW